MAKDDVLMYSIDEAYARVGIASYIDKSVSYYFGAAAHPTVSEIRAPWITRERTSREYESVPRRWARDGG